MIQPRWRRFVTLAHPAPECHRHELLTPASADLGVRFSEGGEPGERGSGSQCGLLCEAGTDSPALALFPMKHLDDIRELAVGWNFLFEASES